MHVLPLSLYLLSFEHCSVLCIYVIVHIHNTINNNSGQVFNKGILKAGPQYMTVVHVVLAEYR